MSNEEQPQQQMTVDDVWVNRLAMQIGMLTAQNERMKVEIEALKQQLGENNTPEESGFNPPVLNGELVQ